WNVAGGKQVQQWLPAQGRQAGFGFSADGRTVAVGSDNVGPPNPVMVYEAATGKELARLESRRNQSVRLALSADGKLLASWGTYAARGAGGDRTEEQVRSQTVQLWDVTSGKELRKLRAESPSGYNAAAAFAPDGKTLAVSSGVSTVRIWDTESGKELT